MRSLIRIQDPLPGTYTTEAIEAFAYSEYPLENRTVLTNAPKCNGIPHEEMFRIFPLAKDWSEARQEAALQKLSVVHAAQVKLGQMPNDKIRRGRVEFLPPSSAE
jgi:hypothetical protein